jgi:hypothetical protein
MGENPADRGRRDAVGDPGLDEGTRQFGAIPLGETPSTEFRALTGQLDQMYGNVGGKSPGGAPGELYLPDLGGPAGGNV